ncbi:MAG: VOC family protein [Planctomycetota bacterium]|jgi:predicted enzyme related to lactoylglutathione lyase
MNEQQFHGVAPAFACKDFPAMVKFYSSVMGFAERYRSDVYCVLGRGETSIHLYPERDGFKGGQGSAYFFVTGVDAIYDSLQGADGVNIVHSISNQEYGLRDFLMADLEGNHVGIAQDINT